MPKVRPPDANLLQIGNAYKARPHSTVKVPDALPAWKRSLWRKIWRAAFLVVGDETLARRIATGVVSPPAIKPPPDLVVPSDVPQDRVKDWIQISGKAEHYTKDARVAQEIAYRVTGKAEMTTNTTSTKQSSIKTASEGLSGVLVHQPGGLVTFNSAVKSADSSSLEPIGEGVVEGYLVTWGHRGDTDLQGEFFTPRTEFCLDWFTERPVLYHHGMDGQAGLRKIGTFKTIKADDLGLWVQAQLDMRDRYARAVYDMVKMKQFGWSSGSVDHLVKIGENGEILVWPLIEGSITPTPAQPAKTTVRAFKALLSDSDVLADYLRGLEDRVEKASALNFDEHRSTHIVEGVKSMSFNNSYYITRAVAKAFGLKDVSEEELKAVASEVAPVVQEEIAAASDDLDDVPVSSYRSHSLRRGFRSDDLPLMGDDDLSVMADEEAVLMDEIAAQMEEDALEEAAARALRRKAWNRAIRQIVEGEAATDPAHMGEPASENLTPLLQETAKRFHRGYRADEPLPFQSDDEDAVMNDEILNDVATQAYRTGFRSGLRSAYRQIEDEGTVASDELVAAQMEDALASIADPTVMADEDVEAAARAYRMGYRKGLNRAIRQMEEAIEADEEAVLTDELEPAKRLRRGYRADAYLEPDAGATDYETAPTGYEPVPVGGVNTENTKYLRRAYRQLDEPVLADEFEDATMADEEEMAKYLNRRPRAYRSAYGFDGIDEITYLRNRVRELETMEAPGQRGFKSLGITSIRDEADRPGAYEHAFKSYLMKGLAAMMDSEKYVLMGKGKANWGGTSIAYDSATKSVKTYTGGSDGSAGFLVPEDWVNELNKNIMTQTVMAGECRTRTTTSDRIVQPNLVTDDARVAHAAKVRWPGESPSSNAEHRTIEDQFSQINIPIHVMLISLSATNSILEDAAFNLEEEINEAFSEAVAVAYDQLIWAGDGQGKMQGIVVNNQVVDHPSLGVQTVGGYIATGSNDGIVTADTLKAMLFHLPQNYRQRAKFYMNSTTGLQIATLKDGEGNYLIDQRDESLRSVGIPDRLLGKPIVYNEWASDIGVGQFPIILADLSRGYIIGRRVEFSIRRFDDSLYAEHDQVLFLGRARLGGQVLQPAAFKVLKVAES